MKGAIALSFVGLLAAANASAQDYGGGFIELLMTGRDPAPRTQAYRPAPAMPAPHRQHAYEVRFPGEAQRGYAVPYPGGPQSAALPVAPERVERPIPARFQRQTVDYDGRHAPGTIVIDTPAKYLYLVQPGGKALRYGIGVGRPGFEWAGMKTVSMKREWPDWRPPGEMLRRRPDLPRYMAGGPENPLGARALYLGSSLYRIHGTNEPHTIGQALSSGCIRLTNDDVVDLYDRVRVGAKVFVI